MTVVDNLDAIFVGEYETDIPLVHDYAHRYDVAAALLRDDEVLAPRVRRAELAAAEDFVLAHEQTYGAELSRTADGLVTRFPRVPLVFERQGLGGTLAVVRHALAAGRTAYHLGGGYHHARWARPGSIDFVNDVAAGLVLACQARPGTKVLHLDLDAHAPDGAHEILAHGVCAAEIDSISLHMHGLAPATPAEALDVGLPWNIDLPPGCGAPTYLGHLNKVVDVVRGRGPYSFVFVQAGVDPRVGDPTANLALDDRGLYDRDVVVAGLLAQLGCPAAVVLGGGHAGALSGRAAYNTVRALAGLPMHEEDQ